MLRKISSKKSLKYFSLLLILSIQAFGASCFAGNSLEHLPREKARCLAPRLEISRIAMFDGFLRLLEEKDPLDPELSFDPVTKSQARIVLCQYAYGKKIQAKDLAQIRAGQPDFLVLPEYYFMHRFIEKLVPEKRKSILDRAARISRAELARLKNMSRELSATIISGSLIEKVGEDVYYNTCYVFCRGRFVGKHRKLMLNAEERSLRIKAGNALHVFSVDGLRIAVLLSDDIFVPGITRMLDMSGPIDILFLPFSSPAKSEMRPGVFAAKRRLLQWIKRNRVYLVKVGGVNTLLGEKRRGKSRVFGKEGLLFRSDSDDREELITLELDLRTLPKAEIAKNLMSANMTTAIEFVQRNIRAHADLPGEPGLSEHIYWVNANKGVSVYKKETDDARYEFLAHLICWTLDRYFRRTGDYSLPHISPPLLVEKKAYYQFFVQGGEGVPLELREFQDWYDWGPVHIQEYDAFFSCLNSAGVRVGDDLTDPDDARVMKNIICADSDADARSNGRVENWKIIDFDYRNVKINEDKLSEFIAQNKQELKSVLNGKTYKILVRAVFILKKFKEIDSREFLSLQNQYLQAMLWWIARNTESEDSLRQMKIIDNQEARLSGQGV